MTLLLRLRWSNITCFFFKLTILVREYEVDGNSAYGNLVRRATPHYRPPTEVGGSTGGKVDAVAKWVGAGDDGGCSTTREEPSRTETPHNENRATVSTEKNGDNVRQQKRVLLFFWHTARFHVMTKYECAG